MGKQKGKAGMYQKFQPGVQRHILSECREKYGEDFVGLADVNRTFNNANKLTGLIRTIFRGHFDFTTYGQYLFAPVIIDRLIELSDSKAKYYYVSYVGTSMVVINPEMMAQHSINPIDANCINNTNKDQYMAWNIVRNSLVQTKLAGSLDPLYAGVNAMDATFNSEGMPLRRNL